MKIKFISLLFFLSFLISFSQDNQDPILQVGLESLTFAEGVIDVPTVSKIIARKQNELKREGIKRYIFRRLPRYNYTTKLFMQNSIITLIDERNQNIIETELLELSTNYALVMGFSKLYKQIYLNQDNSAVKGYYDYLKSKDTIPENQQNQLFIDIVGTALSSNKYLKKRGFFDFDSKIDFKRSNLYNDLKKVIHSEPKVFENLIGEINVVITSYLESYKYIKDILVNEDYSKLENIKEYYFNQLGSNFIDNKEGIIIRYAQNSNNQELIDAFKTAVLLKSLESEISSYKTNLSKIASINERESIENLISIDDSIYNPEQRKLLIESLGASKLTFQTYMETYSSLNRNLFSINEKLRLIKNATAFIKEQNPSFISFKANVENEMNRIKKMNIKSKELNQLYEDFTLIFRNIKNLKEIKVEDVEGFANLLDQSIGQFQSINDWDNFPDALNFKTLKPFMQKFSEYENKLKNDAIRNKNFLKEILRSVSDSLITKNFNSKDSLFIRENASFFADLYVKTRKLSQKKDFSIDDIVYFENVVIPKLAKAKILVSDKNNDEIVAEIIEAANSIIPLMKYYLTPKELEKLDLDEDILTFFGFISNINKLDKANTFTFILQLLDESHQFFIKTIGKNDKYDKFKIIYEKVINGIEKYTIVNTEKEVIEIDVVSFLNTFIETYNKENAYARHSLYFTLGLSQNFFLSNYNIEGASEQEDLESVGFASEKIGYKLKLVSFKNKSYENLANPPINSFDKINEPNPFVNDWYVLIYGSGVLYKVANLTTNENFDFPHIGFATGIRFYNTLDVNLSIGFPFIDDERFGNNAFIGLSMDIPIGEYLAALGSKL